MVAIAFVGQAFSLSTVLVYTFGVFAKPLAAEFHTGRAAIALATSGLDLMVTLGAPLAGRLVDRHGARTTILGSLLALAACLLAFAAVHPPLWHLYALYLAAGLLGVATTPVTYSQVLANWFDRRRGLALGVASTGIGLGAFLGPPLAQYLLSLGGWRAAFLGMAALPLLAAPLVALGLRDRPEDCGWHADAAPAPPPAAPTPGLCVRAALGTPTFWLLCAIFFLVGAAANGVIAHLLPLLTDRGVAGADAAFAASLFGLGSIAGRIGSGYLADRVFAPYVAAAFFAAAALGACMLWSGAGVAAAMVAAVLLGTAIGGESDLMPFLVSRYFGMASMATLLGFCFGAYTLGNAVGRYLIALSFDASGSYRHSLAAAAAALALAALSTLALGPYRWAAAQEPA